MNSTQLRKLAGLANFLDDLPSDRFHMPTWSAEDRTKDSCGSAGCACGWAATIYRKDWVFDVYGEPRLIKGQPYYCDALPNPVSYFAEYFGITKDESFWITLHLSHLRDLTVTDFGVNKIGLSYTEEHNLRRSGLITPRHAADRIRKVIRRHCPEWVNDEPRMNPARPWAATN